MDAVQVNGKNNKNPDDVGRYLLRMEESRLPKRAETVKQLHCRKGSVSQLRWDMEEGESLLKRQ